MPLSLSLDPNNYTIITLARYNGNDRNTIFVSTNSTWVFGFKDDKTNFLPSNLPTTSPTLSPTSKTLPPSTSPTSKTLPPSISPTALTASPSTSPTTLPTSTSPTSPTISPTLSPTFLPICGTNHMCLTVNFYPAKSLSTPVSVIIYDDHNYINYVDPDSVRRMDITFIPRDADCTYPSITFTYDQTVISNYYQYINIYNNNGNMIEKCKGNPNYDVYYPCSIWSTCVYQRSLGIDIIPKDSRYNISVIEVLSMKSQRSCSPGITANASLTLTCQSHSLAPTTESKHPTISPTISPTTEISPTIEPTLSPTFLPICGTNKLCSTVNFYPVKSLSTPVHVIITTYINGRHGTTYVD
eukprot:75457_1